MSKEQHAHMNQLIKEMKGIFRVIVNDHFRGNYDKELKYIEQEEQLITRFQGNVPEKIKEVHILWLWYRAVIYAYKGNLTLSFKESNKLLRIGQLYDNNWGISAGIFAIGNYYMTSGDLDRALVYFDRAIMLCEENLNDTYDFIMLVSPLWLATWAAVDKEDLERAKKYFTRLEEIKELKSEDPNIYDMYRMAKAVLLKSSMRSRNRVLSEDLFREIIEEERPAFIFKLTALSKLCELLLVELRVSNDIDLISEIKPLIEKLIVMAQKSSLYYYLIEAYILHGKLSLIMYDINSSRRFLTQARRMAERHGYNGLADVIVNLHETIVENLDKWEQLEKSDAPLSTRMDLARLDDHLKGNFRTRMMKMERVIKEEITIYKSSQTCLVCKGNAEGFNIYICPTCNSIYCRVCTQAVVELENRCWSCNSPIDPTKPVKPYKPEGKTKDIKKGQKSRRF